MEVTATVSDRSVDSGTEMTVSCTTSHNWKTCAWLYDGKKCQYEYAYNESRNEWTYDKILCNSNFGDHTFVTPQDYHLGNSNMLCKITFESVTYEGQYICEFQRCNQEENNFCKTKVSADRQIFSASINVKVKYVT